MMTALVSIVCWVLGSFTLTDARRCWSYLARRNQRKKRALAEANHKFHTLADENQGLLREWEEAQAQNYEVAEHLRSEVVLKNDKIIELENEMIRLETLRQDSERDLVEKAAAREAKMRQEFEAKQREMQLAITSSELELSKIQKFRNEYEETMEMIAKLKSDNSGLEGRVESQKEEADRCGPRFVHGTRAPAINFHAIAIHRVDTMLASIMNMLRKRLLRIDLDVFISRAGSFFLQPRAWGALGLLVGSTTRSSILRP